MTELLEETRHSDEVLASADPEALIAEARRRQRKRQLLIALTAAAATALGLAAVIVLWNSSTHSSPRTGGAAEIGQPTALRLHLRGFGTPLPTPIDQGPCPQGRTLIDIQPSGSATGCVLTIRKWDETHYGIKKITQTVRETYRLSGGTLITRETQTIHFARDQRHTTAVFHGTVIGGSGRYTRAQGTVTGGGPGVNGHGDWTVTMHLS